jgi:hypothetical protein
MPGGSLQEKRIDQRIVLSSESAETAPKWVQPSM